MKNIVLLFLLLISQLFLAQNHKIAQLLNQQLQKEITHLYTDEERENFIVTEPFRIDENSILHFGYTIKSYDGGKISVYIKIPLNKIINIGRDHNIYFETLDNDVTETQTHYEKNGNILKTKTEQTHLFSGIFSFAQQEKITKLLNDQFKKEQKMYKADDFDKPKMIQPFQIQNDTLSVAFSYQTDEGEIQYFRQVNLKDIKRFEKDMNVLFIAKDGSVKETILIKKQDGMIMKTEVNDSHLFFTELRKDFKNKSFQKKITKAFEKAGYPISGEYWFD